MIILGFLSFIRVNAAERRQDLSESRAQSKKHGIFIGDVNVHPTQFRWEGHQVVVQEAWLESYGYADDQGKSHSLSIKFLIDGKAETEERIARKEGKSIELRRDGVESRYQPRFLWYKSPLQTLMGGREKGVIHYILVPKDAPPSSIAVRVGTRKYSDKTPINVTDSMSDVVLTFEL